MEKLESRNWFNVNVGLENYQGWIKRPYNNGKERNPWNPPPAPLAAAFGAPQGMIGKSFPISENSTALMGCEWWCAEQPWAVMNSLPDRYYKKKEFPSKNTGEDFYQLCEMAGCQGCPECARFCKQRGEMDWGWLVIVSVIIQTVIPALCILGCCCWVGIRRNELQGLRKTALGQQMQNVANGIPYKQAGGGINGQPGTFINPSLGMMGGGGQFMFPNAGGPKPVNIMGPAAMQGMQMMNMQLPGAAGNMQIQPGTMMAQQNYGYQQPGMQIPNAGMQSPTAQKY